MNTMHAFLCAPQSPLVSDITHRCLRRQDVKSRSWLVRMYYRNRMFMGVCCISCEVLYLSVRVL